MRTDKTWRNPAKQDYINKYQVTGAIYLERFREYFSPDYYQIKKFNCNGQKYLRHGSPLGNVGA